MTTWILIGLTSLVSVIGFSQPDLIQRLLLWPPAVSQRRQYERLVTHGFVHADVGHLFFNMLTLYFFGRAVEGAFDRTFGPGGFAFFYVLALIAAILPTYLRHRDDANYRSLGASGAVSAVLFAFIVFRPWSTIYVYVAPVPAVLYAVFYVGYSIWQDFQQRGNVNHSAHLWGALFGAGITLLTMPHALDNFLAQIAHPQLQGF